MGSLKTKGINPAERRRLLKLLTYEKVKGKPIYYRDYKRVLRGELPPEAVMGSSELHAILVALIIGFLSKVLPKEFIVLTGELGFIYAPRSFRSLDIAIYRKEDMKRPADKYTKKPPLVVIEIDTKADLSGYSSFEEYVYEKTQDLLDSGVERVIWYMSKVKKVLIAQKGKDWIVKDWGTDVEVLEDVKLNVAQLLRKEGIEV
ncbi:MAG: Uma2 family endonuclease [Aquificae bacterium]|nr:Uma2 family endonuclease [Aquificota bacterium]